MSQAETDKCPHRHSTSSAWSSFNVWVRRRIRLNLSAHLQSYQFSPQFSCFLQKPIVFLVCTHRVIYSIRVGPKWQPHTPRCEASVHRGFPSRVYLDYWKRLIISSVLHHSKHKAHRSCSRQTFFPPPIFYIWSYMAIVPPQILPKYIEICRGHISIHLKLHS